MNLLKKLSSIHAPSGNESAMQHFLLDYIHAEKSKWAVQPEVISGEDFQHCIILIFGQPRTAVYAHIDNIGFTVRYDNQLVRIGGPKAVTGYRLTGSDSGGLIDCELHVNEEDNSLSYKFNRTIDRGTTLNFKQNYREDNQWVQTCYLDNRLGVYTALKLAETLEHGAIVFSCWEEHGGGSVAYLCKYLWDRFRIKQALISDITWVTEGVHPGKGVAVSMRDSGLPRKVYIDKIRAILDHHQISYQLEVENAGGSDGNELQKQPYPIDWCFVGAPEDMVHSPDEKVHKDDIRSMLSAYQVLMQEL
ncbi:MAG: M20/M25/M40 family metallo-hydrolase [Bacteroidia bacterium]